MIDVSVIIPTFNRINDLERAILSVFEQQHVNIECIVIDDRSTDGTVEKISRKFHDQNLVVIEKPFRSGAQSSRNLGISAAKGEFITFLDSDDYFEPNTMYKRISLCRGLDLNALFSGYYVRFPGRKWNLVKKIDSKSHQCPRNYTEALYNFKISPMITIMYRKSVHNELRLDESLTSGHDDDLCLRLIHKGKFAFDDILAATIVQHVGARIATPANLIIGDAQLFQKYASELIHQCGYDFYKRRFTIVFAGLLSVGQFKRLLPLLSIANDKGMFLYLITQSLIYVPYFWLVGFRKSLMYRAVRSVL